MALITLPLTSYVYVAASNTVTFSSWPSVDLARIVSIKNLTRDAWAFKPTDMTNFGGTVAANVLTFTATIAGAANTDVLLIVYDAPESVSYVGAANGSVGNNLLLTSVGAQWIDTQGMGVDFRSISMSISSAGAVSAGQVFFECSEDAVNASKWQVVDKDYAWLGAAYSAYNPRSAAAGFAQFEGRIPARYVRARIGAATTTNLTVSVRLMTKEPSLPQTAQAVPSERLTSNTSNLSLSGQLVGAVGAGTATRLQQYFCGIAWGDGGSGTVAWDCWVGAGTTSSPSNQKFCMMSESVSSGGDREGGFCFPPNPIPCGVANGIQAYLNNGTMNAYYTVYFFSAPY